MISATLMLVILTVVISVGAFSNQRWQQSLLLNPYEVTHKREYWRLLSHGFIHANGWHLAINMFVFYSFGLFCERYFAHLSLYSGLRYPLLHFMVLYLGGIIVASIPSVIKHRDNPYYRSVGASGGVAAIVFATILFQPLQKIYFYFIIFGIFYLIYSQIMAKRGQGNINHEAHFTGAVFGLIYPILVKPELLLAFIRQLDIF